MHWSSQRRLRQLPNGIDNSPPDRGASVVSVLCQYVDPSRAFRLGCFGDDPAAIIAALTVAARDGARPSDLGRALAYAAALRVARFGIANEHSDWETAHHVFTYANAVHQALKRIGSRTSDAVEASRGLLHGAMALYLARYLNLPPAPLPGDGGEGLEDLPVAADEIHAALLDTFDRQQQIGAAARHQQKCSTLHAGSRYQRRAGKFARLSAGGDSLERTRL